jgi:phosphoribosylformimino-5-aminoimidazole carboxamide ribotide isomerase
MQNILIIPSIDIKEGKTVRVVQGIPELGVKEYGNDPVEMALLWRAENAKCIHVVDFDYSQNKSRSNRKIVEEICGSVVIPVLYGGGIDSCQAAEELIQLGVYRVVIGSLAYTNPAEFKKIIDKLTPNKIAAAIDVVDGEVVIASRKVKTGMAPEAYAKKLKEFGAVRFLVTDVKRNGMLNGPNIELSKRIADVTGGKVTLSGGISGFKDLLLVQEVSKDYGIDSVIMGRALYENKFSCQKIWRIAESGIF